ncbi:MAG: hypothetical protein EXR45_02405 [Chloroflexi bacterium]|nr:hypothetical protein [Chloroflexota bacterium]
MATATAIRANAEQQPTLLPCPAGASLLSLASAIETAIGMRVILNARDLPPLLQTRTSLIVLKRRADRRGKLLSLIAANRDLRRMGAREGIDAIASSDFESVAWSDHDSASGFGPAGAVPAVAVPPPPTFSERRGDDDDLVRSTPDTRPLTFLARQESSEARIGVIDDLMGVGEPERGPDDVHLPHTTPSPPIEIRSALSTVEAWLDIDVTPGRVPAALPQSAASGALHDASDTTPAHPEEDRIPARRTHSLRIVRGPGTGTPGKELLDNPDASHDLGKVFSPSAPNGSSGGGGEGRSGVRRPAVPLRSRPRLLARGRTSGRIVLEPTLGERRHLEKIRRLAGDQTEATETGRVRPTVSAAFGGFGVRGAGAIGEAVSGIRQAIETGIGSNPVRNAGRSAPRIGPVALSFVWTAVVVTLRWVFGFLRWLGVGLVRLPAPVQRGLVGLAGVSVLFGMFVWYVVPAATVDIVPVVETWSTTMSITIDPGARKADPVNGRIPGKWIVKEVTETAQVPTSGKRTVPDWRATGDVVFVNRSNKAITVPKGTIVLAGSQRFATQADFVVAGTTFSGTQRRSGFTKMQVQAVVGGPAGNVEKQQIVAIEGPLAGQLDVQNDVPLRGGTERAITFVSADDRRRAQENAQKSATDKLASQVKSVSIEPQKEVAVPLTTPGATGIGPGGMMSVSEVTFSKNENDEATSVQATVKVRYAVTTFALADVQELAQGAVINRIAQERPGFAAVTGTARVQTPDVGSFETVTGQVQVRAKATASVVPVFNASDIRAAISGLTPDEARAHLRSLSGAASTRLEAWPEWKSTLPRIGWRISVTTRSPNGSAP